MTHGAHLMVAWSRERECRLPPSSWIPFGPAAYWVVPPIFRIGQPIKSNLETPSHTHPEFPNLLSISQSSWQSRLIITELKDILQLPPHIWHNILHMRCSTHTHVYVYVCRCVCEYNLRMTKRRRQEKGQEKASR